MTSKLDKQPDTFASPIPTYSSPPAERLTGFDLMRGFAAFAVIFLHSDLVSGAITVQGHEWDIFFSFAVPFFLLASFYFAAKPSSARISLGQSVKARAKRLLVPYAIWTGVYIALRAGLFIALHQPVGVHTVKGSLPQPGTGLLADPVGILLVGGSALHLYFLPLLFTGLIALTWAKPFLAKAPTPLLGALFLGAIAAYTGMLQSGNTLSLKTHHAFEHSIHFQYGGVLGIGVRLVLILLAFLMRCLPLILLAFLLRRAFRPEISRSPLTYGVLGAAGLALLLTSYLPGHLSRLELDEVLAGLGAFLVAFALSGFVPTSPFVSCAGAYAFGIYLCHAMFLVVLQAAFQHRGVGQHAQGPLFLLPIALLTFVLAWLTVFGASRLGAFMKTAFAL